jgi:hypothetical protein
MARSYKRDARGRFAGGGYSGQTGGRGARLTAKGERKGGGAKMTAGRVGGTIGKPKGLKPGTAKVKARAGGTATVNRTRAQAAAAQRQRTSRLKRPTASTLPQATAPKMNRPSEPLILGKRWDQIQSAQQGKGFRDGLIRGKVQRPGATAQDAAVLRKQGARGLKRQGMYGTLDRLTGSKVLISRPRRRR